MASGAAMHRSRHRSCYRDRAMADEPARGRRRTVAPEPPKDPATEPAAGQEELFGDLSGIAREAVRSPADPRLDAHLRFLGLGDTSDATTTPTPGTAGTAPAAAPTPVMGDPLAGPPGADAAVDPGSTGRPATPTEIDQLRAAVARLQTEATETSDRLRQLTFVIGVLAIATVVALIIGIVR